MGRPVIDLTGKVFERLTVLGRAETPKWDTTGIIWWLCRCTCGNEHKYRGNHLKSGAKSCGCQGREAVRDATRKHGMYKSREYDIWAHILQRCENPKNPLYARYGAKGLTVDPSWRTFVQFYADMGPSPEGSSLDRIDNSKGYTPGNCRWADIFLQNRNRSLSNFIEWNGERLTVSEWSRKLHVTRNTIKNRWLKHQSLSPLIVRHLPAHSNP